MKAQPDTPLRHALVFRIARKRALYRQGVLTQWVLNVLAEKAGTPVQVRARRTTRVCARVGTGI